MAPHLDLLLRSVTVLTGETTQPLLRNAAIAVKGDRIAWIGEHFVHMDAGLPELAKLGMRVHASLRLQMLISRPWQTVTGVSMARSAMGRDVEMVLVDGRCVVHDGRPTLVDMDEILTAANRVAARLWEHAA